MAVPVFQERIRQICAGEATLVHSRALETAMARPIPVPAPVKMATFPANLVTFFLAGASNFDAE
jgi:hypothetical protein